MPVTVIVRSGSKAMGAALKDESPSITFDAPMIVIGRGEGCDVRLPDPSVSHRHATIRQRGSDYIIVDEGSTNGTHMGGVKLGAQAPRILRPGDLARVGRVWLEIRIGVSMGAPQTTLATKELALALVARALDAQGEAGGPRIKVISGPDAGQELALEDASRAYIVGRGQEVDLVLEDADASRRHVQFVRRADQVLVRDLGSKNGSELGGVRLSTDRDRVWKPGEQLVISANVFEFEHAAVDALGELERAADETMRSDEPILPPEFTDAAASKRDSVASRSEKPRAEGQPESLRMDQGDAPIAEVPRASASPQVHTGSGWNGTDWLVVLLAVGVLGLSVVGLFWLLKG